MMSAMGKPFAEPIKIGEMVENGLKIVRILSQSAIRAMSQEIQSGSGGVTNRKKKEEVEMAASGPRNPRPPRSYFSPSTPQHYYPHQDVAYAMVPQPYAVMNAQPYARPQQQFNRAPPLHITLITKLNIIPDLYNIISPTMPMLGNHPKEQTSRLLVSHILAFSLNWSKWVCYNPYPRIDKTQSHLPTDPVPDVPIILEWKDMTLKTVGL